ncbi:hypothetical protein DEJ13_02215 [Curtobacterium sp. MCLR17_007]|uniref:hypothetical protein n=1 Tax=Curtobacterium sp. MCLR17_007 TaxID=2175648 RepID=UPI000DA9810D|nr:hypothetical protein [Curtobacterium sp. MCLR17_007]WIB60664.1 hypothetical protein DEJ13_02215 [Curtobacterium sp. MCLR17_007]
MAHDSLPELELANVRTRERMTDTVERIRHKVDLPARTRLAVAKTRQQWHRDPTPLVALGMIAAAGVASVVIGTRIGRTPAGHLATPPASSAFTALLPFGARGGDESAPGRKGRKARKAGRKARQAQLEQDPGYQLRKKQRKRLAPVTKQATKYRKQAAKRAKAN